MEFLKECPICRGAKLEVLRKQRFVAEGPALREELSPPVSDRDERLWIYFHKIRRDLSPSELAATICESCGFIFFNPRLTEAEITTKYETINTLGFDQQRHRKHDLLHIGERRRRVYDLMASVIGPDLQGKQLEILDYGGAEGHLLVPFAERGHATYLLDYVVYPTPDPNIRYLGRDLDDLPEDRRFDVIFLLHTLEHVVHPVELLSALRERLRPGGWLYVETPLGVWLEWEFLREPLTHVNFFSEQSLAAAADRAGLHTVHLDTQWQWVTKTKNPCVNMVCSPTPGAGAVAPRSSRRQMRALAYAREALRVNARYYGKSMLKSYLRSWM
jgi:SAM-dependent methyltransferase